MTIATITDTNINEVLEASTLPVILCIGADWCIDCKRLDPFFKQFAERYGDKLLFAHCDMQTNPAVKERFAVRHIPTVVHLNRGQVLDTLVEPKTLTPFKAFIEKALQTA